MFWSWLWGLAVRKAGLLKGVPEGQVNAYTAGAVGAARTCAKTVCVEVTVEVLGQGWGVVYAMCAPVQWILCGLPLGTVAVTQSHVECVLVNSAPVTTRPPWSNRGASYSCQFFCVY